MRSRIAAVAGGAALAVSLTACGTSGLAGSDGGGGHKGAGGVALTAEQIVAKSAKKTSDVRSYKMTLDMNVKMSVGGSAKSMKLRGHGGYQLKPEKAFDLKMNIAAPGLSSGPMNMEERLVGGALYLKVPALSKLGNTGKPWMKLSTGSGTPGAASLKSLTSQSKKADPRAMMTMLTSSTDVRKVGTATVDGVSTTHYTGTFDASRAMGKLSAKQRAALRSQLSQLSNMHFDLWADSSRLPRKIKLSGKTTKASYVMVEKLSGFNSPVHVVAPPAGQVKSI